MSPPGFALNKRQLSKNLEDSTAQQEPQTKRKMI